MGNLNSKRKSDVIHIKKIVIKNNKLYLFDKEQVGKIIFDEIVVSKPKSYLKKEDDNDNESTI